MKKIKRTKSTINNVLSETDKSFIVNNLTEILFDKLNGGIDVLPLSSKERDDLLTVKDMVDDILEKLGVHYYA